MQTDGIGSRHNRWIGKEGNFFASFALTLEALPPDLPLASVSIYVSWLMREVLHEAGAKNVWLKWPNDFYVDEKKAGGTVTHLIQSSLIWGIGVNLVSPSDNFGSVKIATDARDLWERYLRRLKKLPTWKQVFSEYKIEFDLSRRFSVHTTDGKQSLKKAVLCDDGSLIIDGRKVYSRR